MFCVRSVTRVRRRRLIFGAPLGDETLSAAKYDHESGVLSIRLPKLVPGLDRRPAGGGGGGGAGG